MPKLEAIDLNSTVYDLADASAVHVTSETLTDAQKEQARANIGAASAADLTAETEAREAADEAINESLATKADADGSYDEMIVGSAEQLISTELTEEKVPYTLRASGGAADIGNRETDMLVGGTIAWNQLVDQNAYEATKTVSGITFTNNGDGSVTANGTAEQTVTFVFTRIPVGKMVREHKYFFSSGFGSVGSANTFELMLVQGGATSVSNYDLYTSATVYQYLFSGGINDKACQFAVRAGATVTNLRCTPQLIDLTQMFGSTIADYIYSLEQANAGAGVAWFRALFPKDYYAYNAGELMSVQAASHNMVGFNAYNNATGNAHVIGGVQYKITGAYTALALNGTAITPDSSGLFTPTASGILTVTGGDATTTCINLSDPARNGEYEPYALHAYPLDDTLTLRGIPKLDANNSVYYDGDTYASDGTVTRRYGVVDLGTLSWSITNGLLYSNSITDSKRTIVTDVAANAVVGNGFASVPNINTSDDKSFALNVTAHGNNMLYVKDSAYTTAAAFKAAMSGVMLVYELATPATETAATYRNPQIVDPFGTEEYVDAAVTAGTRDVAVPVGHVTQYMADLRGKLQKIPNLPTAAGTYVLKVTVTGGVPTYSWQAQ